MPLKCLCSLCGNSFSRGESPTSAWWDEYLKQIFRKNSAAASAEGLLNMKSHFIKKRPCRWDPSTLTILIHLRTRASYVAIASVRENPRTQPMPRVHKMGLNAHQNCSKISLAWWDFEVLNNRGILLLVFLPAARNTLPPQLGWTLCAFSWFFRRYCAKGTDVNIISMFKDDCFHDNQNLNI